MAHTQQPAATMTKAEFKARWNSDEFGGGITSNDIADCAKAWGLCRTPRTRPMGEVVDAVLAAAGVDGSGSSGTE